VELQQVVGFRVVAGSVRFAQQAVLLQVSLHAALDPSHDARDVVVGQFGERMERRPRRSARRSTGCRHC